MISPTSALPAPLNYFLLPGIIKNEPSEQPMVGKPAIREMVGHLRAMMSDLASMDDARIDEIRRFRTAIDEYKLSLLLRIEGVVCGFYSISPGVIRSKRRFRELVICRQISMTLFMEPDLLNYTTRAASLVYLRDHATAIHARRAVKNLFATDKSFRIQMTQILEMFGMVPDRCKFLQEEKI